MRWFYAIKSNHGVCHCVCGGNTDNGVKIIEGANQVITNAEKEAEFIFNMNFKNFKTVLVDGKELKENDYTANGLFTGKGQGILDPKGNATRAEVATILNSFFARYNKEV